ncbi:MAG TPA: hypothetical protein V6C57_12845 [Coleofasciculaceae cyanobacterium]
MKRNLGAWGLGTLAIVAVSPVSATPFLPTEEFADWQEESARSDTIWPNSAALGAKDIQLAYVACQPRSTGDFRVSSGTISNRWVYEIWQSVDSFYVQYWRQSQSCTQASVMAGFSNQQAAYQAIRQIDGNESIGNIR